MMGPVFSGQEGPPPERVPIKGDPRSDRSAPFLRFVDRSPAVP